MNIVTLTTDWGDRDYYSGIIKGAILSKNTNINIVDISHSVNLFNISHAAYLIKNCYNFFPENTIHLICVDTILPNKSREKYSGICIAKKNNQYFIAADNGVFSLIFEDGIDEIYELPYVKNSDNFTFPEKDIFVNAALNIINGQKLSDIGIIKNDYVKRLLFRPLTSSNNITGHVVHLDCYKNIITNISVDLFNEVGKGRKFNLYFRDNEANIFNNSYSDVSLGESVILLNSSNFIEIAINKGYAAELLGLKVDDVVKIEFF